MVKTSEYRAMVDGPETIGDEPTGEGSTGSVIVQKGPMGLCRQISFKPGDLVVVNGQCMRTMEIDGEECLVIRKPDHKVAKSVFFGCSMGDPSQDPPA